MKQQLNEPSCAVRYANIVTEHGGQDVWFNTDEEADAYDANPDEWAAHYLGYKSVELYRGHVGPRYAAMRKAWAA